MVARDLLHGTEEIEAVYKYPPYYSVVPGTIRQKLCKAPDIASDATAI